MTEYRPATLIDLINDVDTPDHMGLHVTMAELRQLRTDAVDKALRDAPCTLDCDACRADDS